MIYIREERGEREVKEGEEKERRERKREERGGRERGKRRGREERGKRRIRPGIYYSIFITVYNVLLFTTLCAGRRRNPFTGWWPCRPTWSPPSCCWR